MKKNYNAPNITIVNIKMETSLLQAASLGSVKNENANSAAMSRGGSSWDDEE